MGKIVSGLFAASLFNSVWAGVFLCNILGSILAWFRRAWMELHILDHNQRKLPCASLYRTLIISTPVYCLRAKIASCTMHLMFRMILINYVLEAKRNKTEFWKGDPKIKKGKKLFLFRVFCRKRNLLFLFPFHFLLSLKLFMLFQTCNLVFLALRHFFNHQMVLLHYSPYL